MTFSRTARRSTFLLVILLSACATAHRVSHALLRVPDPACEKAELARRYGWTGPNATVMRVGDQTCGVDDWRLGSRAKMVCFDDPNPFFCAPKK